MSDEHVNDMDTDDTGTDTGTAQLAADAGTKPAEDAETAEILRDRAVEPTGFRYWITRNKDPRFESLRAAMNEKNWGTNRKSMDGHVFPARYDRETYSKAFDYNEELLELLILAETEWRVENVARDHLNKKLDIDTTSVFDFRSPAQTKAQFCRFTKNNAKSDMCKKPAIPGTVRCKEHGGELVDAVTRRAVLMSSYLQLVEATGVAVNTLVDVTLYSRNDLARVQAAKEILDRAGLTAELNVTIRLEGEERNERVGKLREKLDAMQKGLTAQVIDTTAS